VKKREQQHTHGESLVTVSKSLEDTEWFFLLRLAHNVAPSTPPESPSQLAGDTFSARLKSNQKSIKKVLKIINIFNKRIQHVNIFKRKIV